MKFSRSAELNNFTHYTEVAAAVTLTHTHTHKMKIQTVN